MSEPSHFGERLDVVLASLGHLCVGLDPHPYLFARWEVDDTPVGLREFSLRVLDECAGNVGLIKPQVAFFERWGSAGYRVLELVLARARDAGMLVIADAKRGDIGSTMEAYAATWLAEGSPLEADALTVSPYLGVGALEQTFELARRGRKGVFLLAATSNPEATQIQRSLMREGSDGARTVAEGVVSAAFDVNRRSQSVTAGVVLGATVSLGDYGIDADEMEGLPVLAPGFGFQGADPARARDLFGALSSRLIVTETRSILESGPDGIGETIRRRRDVVAQALG